MEDYLQRKADFYLAELKNNSYPGRGLVLGVDETGESLIQLYWIMGRSATSRNRIFICDGDVLKTDLADPGKVKPDEDTSLIIYTAMADDFFTFAVSNGHQTMNVLEYGMYGAMKKWQYEPDANYTPRIIGAWTFNHEIPVAQIAILFKPPYGMQCDRILYSYGKISDGYGYCIHTYDGDGEPLPSFSKDPYPIPLKGKPEEILSTYWDALNQDNRVSIALKTISIKSHESSVLLINKHSPV